MRKIFGRKKDDKESKEEIEEAPAEDIKIEDEPEEEPAIEEVQDAAEVEETKPTTVSSKLTIPYHASFKDRLKFMLTDETFSSSIEAPDEFKLEFMAMGERFMVSKKPMGQIEIASGAAPDEDVFIRVANDVVSELLNAATFSEFSAVYLKYYKNAEPGKFVKIELRKPITELNRRGYARIPTLKLLIGAAR